MPSMCHLGRALREKNEGSGEKGCFVRLQNLMKSHARNLDDDFITAE